MVLDRDSVNGNNARVAANDAAKKDAAKVNPAAAWVPDFTRDTAHWIAHMDAKADDWVCSSCGHLISQHPSQIRFWHRIAMAHSRRRRRDHCSYDYRRRKQHESVGAQRYNMKLS
jgi:hypothetical protein